MSEQTETLDFDARYSVAGHGGIAFYLLSYEVEMIWNDEFGEYDENVREDQVRAVMVGDDRTHIIEVEDLTKIHDEDYCSGCGQIGCGW